MDDVNCCTKVRALTIQCMKRGCLDPAEFWCSTEPFSGQPKRHAYCKRHAESWCKHYRVEPPK